jgi:glyoxylase-like metal-dependent hydrolase (beta-lactamase superfamily II)
MTPVQPRTRHLFPMPLRTTALAAVLLTACGDSASDTGAPKSTLDQTVQAMGGAEALQAVANEVVEAFGSRQSPEQGSSISTPRHLSNFRYIRTGELDGSKLHIEHDHVTTYLTPERYQFTEVVNGASGFVNGKDTVFTPAQTSGMFTSRAAAELEHTRLTSPLRVLRKALANPSIVQEEQDLEMDQHRFKVLVFREEGEPELRLLIDPETFLPAAARVLEDQPPLGDTVVEAWFSDYRDVGGVKYPYHLRITLDGVEAHAEDRESIRVNVSVPAQAYDVPASFQPPTQPVVPALADFGKRSTQLLQGLKYLTQTFFYFDQSGLPITLNELAPGVVHVVGPSHHSLLVEMKDYLVLVDAPLFYAERSEATLAAIKAKYPGKPIRYVIASHFHSDHVGGIRHFVADGGVTVLAGEPSVPFYQRAFSHPHTLVPDRLARNPVPVTVEGVKTLKVLDDGVHSVEAHHIQSIHSNDMIIVYLPKEKILFVADLFNPNLFPSNQPAPYIWGVASGGLYDELQRLGLDVERIAGGHGSGTGTMETLRITGAR